MKKIIYLKRRVFNFDNYHDYDGVLSKTQIKRKSKKQLIVFIPGMACSWSSILPESIGTNLFLDRMNIEGYDTLIASNTLYRINSGPTIFTNIETTISIINDIIIKFKKKYKKIILLGHSTGSLSIVISKNMGIIPNDIKCILFSFPKISSHSSRLDWYYKRLGWYDIDENFVDSYIKNIEKVYSKYEKYDNIDKIEGFTFFHGEFDEHFSFDSIKREVNQNSTLHKIEGSGHLFYNGHEPFFHYRVDKTYNTLEDSFLKIGLIKDISKGKLWSKNYSYSYENRGDNNE